MNHDNAPEWLHRIAACSCPYLRLARHFGAPYGMVLAYADYVGKQQPSQWTITEMDALLTLPLHVRMCVQQLRSILSPPPPAAGGGAQQQEQGPWARQQ